MFITTVASVGSEALAQSSGNPSRTTAGTEKSLRALVEPRVVQEAKGYNSWPMIQAMGDKLVCVYSRGTGHLINEYNRGVYARTSTDGGKTWTEETRVVNSSNFGDVAVGSGLDSTGAMLLWVRRCGAGGIFQDLFRSTDGVEFKLVTTPAFEVMPMQITDIFSVPKVGLMALWFAGKYDHTRNHSWGTLVSTDDGATWKQTTIESGLPKAHWPTEPSAVYLGDGRILAVGRAEPVEGKPDRFQFQLESTDSGATWTRSVTNIGDIFYSTPSLVFDAKTGLVSNYYYQRGKGILWRRVADAKRIFGNPLGWPAPEAVSFGSEIPSDSGNVNATAIGGTHHIAFYSGKAPDVAVFVSELAAPTAAGASASRSASKR